MSNPLKILMADDEDAVLEIMARRVANQGYKVVMARNGQEAWNLIKSEDPDIIILDLTMPEMTGWEVLAKIRKEPPSKKWQPVIIVSAQSEIEDVREGLEAQADHYLIKPCRIEDILKSIKLMASLIPQRED